ncbi:hypothetical protein BKA70DRAFT_1266712 [Coprinopsis sp. MPI-PUGE-AT-0042]|nr:hypothetical protein BKA70DRAFT_1266712 [Coprinopsis sp. MPI-PUGE-AT-0042]
MSGSKTISNGTLGLKFMQNALRQQQMKEVRFEKAEVKDEGEWEVSKAVREAWGMTGDSKAPDANLVHEDSYLPFLFSDESLSITQPRGRRIFGKKGEEIIKQAGAERPSEDSESHAAGSTGPKGASSTTPSGQGRKIHPRPITISAAGSSGGYLKGFDQLKQPGARDSPSMAVPTKSARQMLFEVGDVGEDLRRPRNAAHGTGPIGAQPSSPSMGAQPPQGFMKPAGVDEPVRPPSASSKPAAEKPHSQDKKSKRKRLNSQAEQTLGSGTKKQKKDKQNMTMT